MPTDSARPAAGEPSEGDFDPWPKSRRIGERWPCWLRLTIRVLILLPFWLVYMAGQGADAAYEFLDAYLPRGL